MKTAVFPPVGGGNHGDTEENVRQAGENDAAMREVGPRAVKTTAQAQVAESGRRRQGEQEEDPVMQRPLEVLEETRDRQQETRREAERSEERGQRKRSWSVVDHPLSAPKRYFQMRCLDTPPGIRDADRILRQRQRDGLPCSEMRTYRAAAPGNFHLARPQGFQLPDSVIRAREAADVRIHMAGLLSDYHATWRRCTREHLRRVPEEEEACEVLYDHPRWTPPDPEREEGVRRPAPQ